MDTSPLSVNLERAEKLSADGHNQEALEAFRQILVWMIENGNSMSETGEEGKIVEAAILGIGAIFVAEKAGELLLALQREIRPVFAFLPRAKTAKLVRNLIDLLSLVPNSDDLQISACVECIAWCVTEKRAFLRQRVECKLALLQLARRNF